MTVEKKKPEGRPSKKVKEAIKQHEKPMIDIEVPPAGTEEKKKLAILDEKTETYRMYQLLVQGKSIGEIADDLKITPNSIRVKINNAVAILDEETDKLKKNWMSITLSRSEEFMKILLERVMENHHYTRDDVDAFEKLVRIQERVQGYNKPENIGQQNNINVLSIDRDSALYQQGLAEMQKRATGETFEHLKELAEKSGEVEILDGILEDD